MPRCLGTLLGAPSEQRVADHLDAHGVAGGAERHHGSRALLDQHDLLELRPAAAAVLGGPREAEQAVLVERAPPAADERGRLFGRERADARPVVGQLPGEERPHLGAERLGLGTRAEIHSPQATQ